MYFLESIYISKYIHTGYFIFILSWIVENIYYILGYILLIE